MAAATHRRQPKQANRTGRPDADIVVVKGCTHRLADVASYEIEAQQERDCEGQLLCSAIYGIVAAVMLLAIVIGELDWKLVIGVVFIAAIALMCLADGLAVKPVTIYRLRIEMRDGSHVTVAAGAWESVAALAARIDRLAAR